MKEKARRRLRLLGWVAGGICVGLAVLALVAWLLYRTGAKANPNA